MPGCVSIGLLKPHPKCSEYFSNPSPEEYEAVKKSIAAQGIRDPLKVAPDYTVVAGHLRLQIAKELGLEKVPVEIVDGDEEYLEYLLVADNEERRTCRDPVKKAKRAEFLKQYWGVKEGRPQKLRQNVVVNSGKTIKDIAEAVGEDERTVQRLLKLNDLIPPLQELVSQGRLSQTAAYSLAFLPPEEQKKLLEVLGESGVSGLSVSQAKELRRALEEERDRARAAEARLAALERDLASGRVGSAGAVERVVERVVYQADPALEAELEAARRQAAELLRERDFLKQRFRETAEDKEQKEARLREMQQRLAFVEQEKEALRKALMRREQAPGLQPARQEARAAMERAVSAAHALADALRILAERHQAELLAAARVRGGADLGDLAEALGDASLFRSFEIALEAAAGRLNQVFDLLEPGRRPALQVVKQSNAPASP